MKRLISTAASFWFSLSLLLTCTAGAQESAKNETSKRIAGESKPVAVVQWRVTGKQGHLRCEVWNQISSTKNGPLTRVFTIYDDGKLAKVFEFETPDSLLNVYPLGDYNARLFTTWVGGSAYHLRVFAFIDGHVKQVLEEGSKLPPEFFYDEEGRESVLLTDPVIENGKWTSVNGTTTVFKWNGRSYDRIGKVPWAKRLQCVSTEVCASLRVAEN